MKGAFVQLFPSVSASGENLNVLILDTEMYDLLFKGFSRVG